LTVDERTQKLGEMLAQIRNGFQGAVEAVNAYLNYLGQLMEPTFVREGAFTIALASDLIKGA